MPLVSAMGGKRTFGRAYLRHAEPCTLPKASQALAQDCDRRPCLRIVASLRRQLKCSGCGAKGGQAYGPATHAKVAIAGEMAAKSLNQFGAEVLEREAERLLPA